jgi:ATP-binding cassette subfamily B (MDR/TAP) protein 1
LGILKEVIWMTQPKGYESDDPQALCLLLKTLYGLKQSPREWNEVLDDFLKKEGFHKCVSDPCICASRHHFASFCMYIDDIVTVGKAKR